MEGWVDVLLVADNAMNGAEGGQAASAALQPVRPMLAAPSVLL
jgi:hypothetical protein